MSTNTILAPVHFSAPPFKVLAAESTKEED